MRHKQLTAALAAVLLALLVVAAGTAAAPPGDSASAAGMFESEPDPVSRVIVDPRSAYEPSEGNAFASGVINVPDSAKSASGCRTKYVWIGLKNIVGAFLWKYFQKLGWCWKGGDVTSATPRCRGTWAEVYFPLWDFKGHIECDSSGGVGQTFVRRWRQGKFQLCTVYCFQTKIPWINVRGTSTGAFSWNVGS